MAVATLRSASRALQKTALLRRHKTVVITGLLCLFVLTAPAVFPVSQATKATRWIKDAAAHAQSTTCNADMPRGYGPRVTEPFSDDAQGFLDFPFFTETAEAATTVAGYKLAAKNRQKTVGRKSASNLLGDVNIVGYDPQTCATLCDHLSTCVAFNIYFQRSPRIAPSSATNGACPSPEAMTNIFCSFYSTRLKANDLTRYGELRYQFKIVIAGSNLYNKNQSQAFEWLPKITIPYVASDDAHEQAPATGEQDTYIYDGQ